MTQFTTKLLTSLFAMGCGSGAMAGTDPAYGQWTGYGPGGYSTVPPPSAASQPSQSSPSQSSPSQFGPSQTGQSQGQFNESQKSPNAVAPNGPGQSGQGQSGPSPTLPTPPSPDDEDMNPQAEGAPSDSWDQNQAQDDDDDDSPQSFTQSSGQQRLGVMIMSLTPELRRFFGVTSDRGVLVARVEPGSAAARAGVQVGDVLVRVGRQQVHTGSDVIQAVQGHGGGSMRIAVVRQGRIVRLDATMSGPRRNMQQQQQQQRPIQPDQI